MRTQLKISPSIVDNYRVCMTGLYRKTIHDFVDGLDRPFEQTDAAAKGEAYHLLLERGGQEFKERARDGGIQYRIPTKSGRPDFIFTEEQAFPALETHDNNPYKQHEVWHSVLLDIDGVDVKMNMKMDAIDDPQKVIWDYKTTGRIPDKETYLNSVQWPLYLYAKPDFNLFRYRIFRLHDDGCQQYDYLFERSQAHIDYAMQWLEHLVDFIQTNHLQHKFQPR